jgi:hypothetical protein
MDDDDALGSQPDFGSQPSALGSQDPAAAAASDALLLKHALMNERAAPELLPYEADLVERVQLQLDHQEREIAEAERDRARELLRTIFTLELSRVRYMLRAYLRARLLKLERHVMHALDAPGARARLSPLEDAYAEKFLVLQGSHLKRAVADKLPGEPLRVVVWVPVYLYLYFFEYNLRAAGRHALLRLRLRPPTHSLPTQPTRDPNATQTPSPRSCARPRRTPRPT